MKKTKSQRKKPLSQSLISRALLGTLAAATAFPLTTLAEEAAVTPPPPPASRVNVLMNFEFADSYLTPRGMVVTDQGLTFQSLVLGLVNVYKGDGFITDVTLTPGIWNDFCTSPLPNSNGDGTTSWIEIDPIAGISVSFGKYFTLSETYTAFNMQVLNIPFSQHLESKLQFEDSSFFGKFALHPYFLYWQELQNKATAADVPYQVFNGTSGPGESYYFEVGATPGYTFKDFGELKIEAPCRVLMPNKDFYGEYYGSASTIGLYEVGLKGSLPLKFMPQGYGHWGFHAGFKYMGFVDDNLQGMQEFNAPGESVSHSWQFYCGLSTFF